ncbi:hypothetical protein Plec18167_008785 [Paecilomyces lecythidis]|uniref:WW domain-containing protein n=1 Tax=Paecilomyces lecythidis TaxID=3004212 RepID=A0ABR3WV88_9EURO
MAKDGPLDSEGPSSPPPPLPDGWLAQWEGVERKWYFVQRATGKAQWEIPTEPVILTPSTTPTSTGTGPSRAPSSRPQTNSPPTGMGARGFGAEGGYGGADRAGYSSFFGSPGGAYQTGLSQMAMGMLGRMSNYGPQDKAVGQPGLPGYLAQQNPHQNPYGYMPTGQPGPYTGSPSQYPGAGHVQPTPGMFPHPQSGSPGQYAAIQGAQRLGLQQQFGVDAQGSLSSPFTQVPAHTQGQMAAAVTSSGGPSPFQAGIATTQAQGGSPFAVQSPEQQVTQAPSQPGVESSNPALGEHGTPNDFSGYSQAQQNLSVLSSQAPSVSPNQAALSSAEFPASQYPTTQAFGPFPQTTMPPPGLGPFPQNAPPGFPNAAQQSQYGQGAFGQYGQLPGQNPYGPYPPGAFGLPSQGSPYNAGRPGVTGPPVSVPPYGAQFPTTGPFGVQGAPGTSQLDQFGPQFDPRQYPRPPSDQMGRVAGFNMAPGAVNPQGSFQQYSGPPYTAAGQWSGPGPAQSRSAIYDPQFVSGPWTSAAGYRQASPYGAFGPGK